MPDIFKAHPAPKISKTSKRLNIEGLEKFSRSHFSSFFYLPNSVRFIGKDSDEKIILFLRRHPITNIGWIIITLILLFAPVVLSIFPILSFLPENFRLIGVCIWYIITVAFAFESFLNWFFNVCIITDERIFDVDFLNLIYREISEANIDQVQDITVRMGGVIRTVFNYGDVYIQTASEIPRIEFMAVARPDLVARILRELRVEEEQEKIEGRTR